MSEVSDEMVLAFCRAYLPAPPDVMSAKEAASIRNHVRAALTAALAARPSPVDEPDTLAQRLIGRADWLNRVSPDAVKSPDLLREASATISALVAERDEALSARKTDELEAQLHAVRRAEAEQGERNWRERATAAERERDEARKRSATYWKNLQRLWTLARGDDPDADPDDRPRCRDCGDNFNVCPDTGLSCDPQEATEQRLRTLATANARVERLADLVKRAQPSISGVYSKWHADARAALEPPHEAP